MIVSFLRQLQNNPLVCNNQMCGWLKKLQQEAKKRHELEHIWEPWYKPPTNATVQGTCSYPHSTVRERLTDVCSKNINNVHILCLSTVKPAAKDCTFQGAGREVVIFRLPSFHVTCTVKRFVDKKSRKIDLLSSSGGVNAFSGRPFFNQVLFSCCTWLD